MNQSIFRPIVFGILFGAFAFFMPFFLFHVFFFFLIAGLFFGFFGRRRFYGRGGGMGGWAFADKIRNMSDEEYATFKEKVRSHRGCYRNDQAFQTNQTDAGTQA